MLSTINCQEFYKAAANLHILNQMRHILRHAQVCIINYKSVLFWRNAHLKQIKLVKLIRKHDIYVSQFLVQLWWYSLLGTQFYLDIWRFHVNKKSCTRNNKKTKPLIILVSPDPPSGFFSFKKILLSPYFLLHPRTNLQKYSEKLC